MVQPQQAKKGLGVWAWVAIGCVGFLVLGAMAVGGFMWWGARKMQSVAQDFANDPTAAIEMALKLNPEVEVIDRDKDAGTVTVRNKKTGETVTLNMEDIQQGRFSFESSEGSATVNFDSSAGTLEVETEDADGGGGTMSFGGGAEVPSWVPTYPGAQHQGVYTADTAEQSGGTFTATTGDDVDTVFAYFKGQLEGGGYKISENRFSGPQGNGGMLVGESGDGQQSLTYTLQSNEGQTQVSCMYSRKKG
jgi:hypothetical protein